MDDTEITVRADIKKGTVTLEGIGPKCVKAIAKAMKQHKRVLIQVFPDGFIVSPHGLSIKKQESREITGYG